MYKYRFYIEKISVQGSSKRNAELTFERGVNIISGSSDTGKSYIFKCIDYMFGAETLPKDIPESRGYTDIYMQIKTFEGKVFTLHRSLKNISNITVSETEIEHFLTAEKLVLGTKNNTRDGNNISEFLLNLINVGNVLLRVNSNNKTKMLSFRQIAQLTMVDESRIITEGSPVYFSMHNYYDFTFEKSVFKYILTGNSDNELVEIEEPKVFQGRIKGKLEVISTLLELKNETITKLIADSNTISSGELQKRLNDLLIKLQESSAKLNELTSSRKELFERLNTLKSDNLRYSELNKRFNLLVEHYQNDLRRLEFISEGEYVFSQLVSTSCPVCGNSFNENHINCLSDKKKVSFAYSVEMEKRKVSLKLNDLKQTISVTEQSILRNRDDIKLLQMAIDELNRDLHNNLLPTQNRFQVDIDFLYHLRERENKIVALNEEVLSLTSQRNNFEKELLSRTITNITGVDIENEALSKFVLNIQDILKEWNYENVNFVTFNEAHKVYDIEISGRARSSHGKGVRAVVYSAFILGLLDYCITNNKRHPGFVILDSPLTTYHSTQLREDGDEVSRDLQNGFFTYLSNIANDRQIIVFDNKTPAPSLSKKFNYVEFSKFDSNLRKGFF